MTSTFPHTHQHRHQDGCAGLQTAWLGCNYVMVRHLHDSVGAAVATTEVRFQDLSIAATVAVGARSLPSLTNDLINMLQARDIALLLMWHRLSPAYTSCASSRDSM